MISLKKACCVLAIGLSNTIWLLGNAPDIQAREYKIIIDGVAFEVLPENTTLFDNTVRGNLTGKEEKQKEKNDEVAEVITKEALKKVDQLAEAATFAYWNPFSSKYIAIATNEKNINILDRIAGKVASTLGSHKDHVACMAWSQAAVDVLATGSEEGALKVWDLKNLKKPTVSNLLWHTKNDFITAISWNRKLPNRLATGGASGRLFLWHTKLSFPINVEWEHESAITALDWHPIEEARLASASRDKSIVIWDIDLQKNRVITKYLKEHDDIVTTIHWNPARASMLASGSLDGYVILWDSKDKFKTTKLSLNNKKITMLRWHPHDSKILAIGTQDGTVYLWSIDEENNAKVLAVLEGHKSEITSLSWLDEKTYILTSAEEIGFVKSWQLK